MNYRPLVLTLTATALSLVLGLPITFFALASAPQPTPTPPLTPTPPPSTPHSAGVWFTHAAENPVVNALIVEDDFIWTATNGDGVVRWNRSDGSFDKYTTATGLVNNKVRAITSDKTGHFWFGTENGVSEFNGHTWTTYTTTHGLIDNKVLSIAVDQANHKWFATWGGVSEFNGHAWTAYTRASGLPSNHIHTITVDRAGHIWIGTPNGAARFDGQHWTHFTSADGLAHNSVHTIVVDQAGQIWLGTPGGVSTYDGRRWITYTTANGLPSNHVQALTVDKSGRIWAATALGLSLFTGDAWIPYKAPSSHIFALAVDEAGYPWLGTADGIVGFDGRDWQTLHTGGLASNVVKAMAEDQHGHKWFATANGVSAYDGHAWTTYTTADGLADNWVNDLAMDASGRLWFATQNGISTFDGHRWTTYTTTDGLPGHEVKDIGRDETGQLWFTIWFEGGSGASRFDGQAWTTITDTQSLPVVWNETSVAVDKAGREWTALGGDGVRIVDGHESVTQGVENLPFVFTVAVDQAGQKWFGGLGGVSQLGLPPMNGTAGSGGGEIDSPKWITYTTENALPRNRVDQIYVDRANHKWFNTMSAGAVEFDDSAAPVFAQTPPEVAPLAPPTPAPNPTVVAPISSTNEVVYPALIGQVSLAPPEKFLRRLLFDDAGHLYILDDAGLFYVLDAATLAPLVKLDIGKGESSEILLDTPNHRLYIFFPMWEDPVTVLDTESLEVVGTISPGGPVSVDSDHNQFYVSNPQGLSVYDRVHLVGASVYDGKSLTKRDEMAYPWITYNPLRDELLSGHVTLRAVDRDTQREVIDMLPDLTAQDCYDCGDSGNVWGVKVFPEQNLIMVRSGNSRYNWPDRFFDATTLDELTDLTGVPAIEQGCGDQPLVGHPINGRIYQGESFSSVSYYYNTLLVYGPDGELETWRDGKALGITNPNTGQMYLPGDGRVWIMDLATLSPLGMFSADCILNLDLAHGRIYARRGGELRVFSEQGGQPEVPPTPDPSGPLPEAPVVAIKVSPGFATDRTIFVQMNYRMIYRSTDGGLSWVRLHGGLPEEAWLDFDLSPNFTQDHTLFAGGTYGYGSGAGMYRSTDDGEIWQPLWSGLSHLQVNEVVISSNYVQDGTVLAYAKYSRFIPSGGEGGSVFRSTNRGLSWSLVITDSGLSPELPAPEELLPSYLLPPLRFRPIQYGVERTTDSGKTWQPSLISHRPEFSALAVRPSPGFETDQTVYVLSNEALYRSTDGGTTWEYGFDQFLTGRTYTNTVQTMAISPLLKDGSHRLFLGSAAGEFWTLNPAEIKWQPVLQVSQWSTIMAGEEIDDITAAPNGDVWLSLTNNGVVRFAADTTQTHYTVDNGLHKQQVSSMAVAPDNTLWANNSGVILSFDGRTWINYNLKNAEGIVDIAVGSDGNIWLGGKGAARWDGHSWMQLAYPENYANDEVADFAVGKDGTLWFATNHGATWYKDGKWSNMDLRERYRVTVAPDGAVYFLAGWGDIQRYFKDKWNTIPNPQPGPFRGYGPAMFYVTKDGAIWVGTRGGVFRYEGQTWRQFTAQDGLPSNNVTAITEDAKGWLWFGTDNGAAYVDPATLGLSPVVW